MCLILFAYKQHPEYKLIIAANRDEFYNRPTSPAEWSGEILSGIDEKAGGTWMGINKSGQLAALTNYRNPADMVPNKLSRGNLVYDYLKTGSLDDKHSEYSGFNLIYGTTNRLNYISNRSEGKRELTPGVYGLSNHLLDTPWVKVERGKRALLETISGKFTTDDLFSILKDDFEPSDSLLPDTGIGIEKERMLSPIFIKSSDYGTVSSTALTIDYSGNVHFTERTHKTKTDKDFRFKICSQ